MDHKEFDKFFRRKLNRLQEPLTPGAWGLFEQKLDAAADVPEQSFDEAFREKLDAMEPAYEPMHWDMMAQQLDQQIPDPEMEDMMLDGIAYENLSQIREPYKPAHWTMMSDRLDTEYSFRRKVYKYKLAEVALMLLLIVTVIQYLPHYKTKGQTVQHTEFNTFTPTLANELNSSGSNNDAKPEQPVSESTVAGSGNQLAAVSPADDIIDEGTTIIANNEKDGALPAAEVNSDPNNTLKELVPLVHKTPSAAGVRFRSQAFSELPGEKDLLPENSRQAHLSEVDALALLDPELEEENYLLPGFDSSKESLGSEKHWRIGMFASTDANYVMTPYNTNKFLPAYEQFFGGYGGGISIGYTIGRWAVETGGTYSNMYYQPNEFRVQLRTGRFEEGWSGIGFKDAQLEIIKVPLNVRYEYAVMSKWRLYAATGITAHVAMYQQYNFEKQYKGETPSSFSAPSPAPSNEPTPAQEQARFNGYLEGGGLQENAYFSANLGIGVERYLSPRWSMFFQPNYQHQLFSRGFGPNGDRFNNLSTFIGVRASLK